MKKLTFLENKNNKLACPVFTAIIPHYQAPTYEYSSREYQIMFGDKKLMNAEVMSAKVISIDELTDFDCMLDSEQSKEEMIAELKQQLGSKQLIAVLLLRRIWNVIQLVPAHIQQSA